MKLMKLPEARGLLAKAALATPSLPNMGSRLATTVHRELVNGRRNCKGALYVVNIFDRASPWILPRYANTFSGISLFVVVTDAITWIKFRTPELHAMSAQVSAAITTMQPFHAKTRP